MISRVSIKQDTAVIWIQKGGNLYGQTSLPTFDYGRITLEPHKTPIDPEDAIRLTKAIRSGNPEWGLRFFGGDARSVKRVIKQVEQIQKMLQPEFDKFIGYSVISTDNTLAEVLASLDCDPQQKEAYAIQTSAGPLKKIFLKKYTGFGFSIAGSNFVVEVVVNKGEFLWSNYQYRKIDSCNYRWINLCMEVDINAKTS